MDTWGLTELPLKVDLETKGVLKALPAAHAALAELKRNCINNPQSKHP